MVLLAAVSLLTRPAEAAKTPEVTDTTAAKAATPQWRPCGNGFDCATETVPLDYADPGAGTIRLAMIRHPATDPAHRLGSVFFNPGGPGGPGVTALPLLYPWFPEQLRARYDVVSFDPRGIGQSTNLKCFDTTEEEQRFLAGVPGGSPVGADEERLWETRYAAFDEACGAHAGPLLAHDTTADVARDLDLMRQAVGDPRLNYLGVSYGTYLGATYANLFPDEVGRLVLDGNVDAVQWVNDTSMMGTFLRLGSDEGSGMTLDAFLDQCGQSPNCAFSAGDPAATHAKFQTLLDRLDAHPVTVDNKKVTRAKAVQAVTGALYGIHRGPGLFPGWPEVGRVLQRLWTAGGTGGPVAVESTMFGPSTFPVLGIPVIAQGSYTGIESQLGVFCSDSPNPRQPELYPVQSALASTRSGAPGPAWAWITEPCAQWPATGAQSYTGPWDKPTANPILLVGTTTDPATPYQGSVALSQELADARLLTLHGFGHTALLNESSCVNAAEDTFFLTGALPAPGTTCEEDQAPFSE